MDVLEISSVAGNKQGYGAGYKILKISKLKYDTVHALLTSSKFSRAGRWGEMREVGPPEQ